MSADTAAIGLELAVHAAVASVDDPEYPGVSVVELGLLEHIKVDPTQPGAVRIGLIPTFTGCPALGIIAADVEQAVAGVPGVDHIDVDWLAEPAWTIDRVSGDARAILATDFTVAVQIGTKAPRCPRCGAATREQSMFGPSKCRSVHRCDACSETVEVMRGVQP